GRSRAGAGADVRRQPGVDGWGISQEQGGNGCKGRWSKCGEGWVGGPRLEVRPPWAIGPLYRFRRITRCCGSSEPLVPDPDSPCMRISFSINLLYRFLALATFCFRDLGTKYQALERRHCAALRRTP